MQPLIPYFEIPVLKLSLFGYTLPIHGFGILVALGFFYGGKVAAKRASRAGLNGSAIDEVIGWLVLGTFIGGHFGYGLMYAREEYLANPILFLQFWKGLSSFGGFVVCVPLAFFFFYRKKLNMWPYMDSLAIGLGLGWFLGRMGCTVAHDHPGTPTTSPLGVYCRPVEGHTLSLPSWLTDSHGDLRWGPCQDMGRVITDISDQVPVDYQGVIAAHDMGFYEALWSLGVFLLFLILDRKPRKPGFFVCLMGVLYAPVRFYMDFLRPASTDNRWFEDTAIAMTPGQFWSIVFMVVASYGLYTRLKSDAPVYGPAAPSQDGGAV